MPLNADQLTARRRWLELSRQQIAEYAGIPICAVDLLESGNAIAPEETERYERTLDKVEFKMLMANLP